jgi:hypothetical protein
MIYTVVRGSTWQEIFPQIPWDSSSPDYDTRCILACSIIFNHKTIFHWEENTTTFRQMNNAIEDYFNRIIRQKKVEDV